MIEENKIDGVKKYVRLIEDIVITSVGKLGFELFCLCSSCRDLRVRINDERHGVVIDFRDFSRYVFSSDLGIIERQPGGIQDLRGR